MNDNVHQITPTPEPNIADLMAIAQRNGAARAVHHVHGVLVQDAKRARDEWKASVDKATDVYRTKMRDDSQRERSLADKASRKVLLAVCTQHWSAVDDLAERDGLDAQAKGDKSTRSGRIATFEAAHHELMQQRPDSAQGTLFDDDVDTAAVLPGISNSTKEIVYSALHHMQTTGIALDAYQLDALSTLGSSGVETFDLGLEASDAVEEDQDEEDPGEEDDDGDHPF